MSPNTTNKSTKKRQHVFQYWLFAPQTDIYGETPSTLSGTELINRVLLERQNNKNKSSTPPIKVI